MGRELPYRTSGTHPRSCSREGSPPRPAAPSFLPFPLDPIVTGFERHDVTAHKVCYGGRKPGTQWHQVSQSENKAVHHSAVTHRFSTLGLQLHPWRDSTLMLWDSPTSWVLFASTQIKNLSLVLSFPCFRCTVWCWRKHTLCVAAVTMVPLSSVPFLSPLRLTVLPLSCLCTALAELVSTPSFPPCPHFRAWPLSS